jgi:hypothetical protein
MRDLVIYPWLTMTQPARPHALTRLIIPDHCCAPYAAMVPPGCRMVVIASLWMGPSTCFITDGDDACQIDEDDLDDHHSELFAPCELTWFLVTARGP